VNVLHVIPALAPRYGGPSAAIAPMCRSLASRNVDLLIATTDADGPGRIALPVGAPTTWQGVPAIVFRRNFSESFKYSSGLAQWLRRHVSEFDVVHIHAVLSHACLSAAAQCRRAGVPYVLRPLGTLAQWSLDQHAFRKRVALALGGRHAVEQAAAIHCTSNEERRGIEREFPGARAIVIPLGIDEEALNTRQVDWPERELDPYVVAVSRLHPKKNLEALMHAFVAAVPAHTAPWRLVIAGDGEPEYVSRLKDLVRELGGGGRVALTGWVDGETKRDLIQHASIFALVSLHENFGLSVLEALAAGVPALATRQVDLAEAIEAAGAGWVCETTVASLRQTLTVALGSLSQRRSFGQAGRNLAMRFAWSGIACDLVNLYQDVRSRSAHAPAAVLSTANVTRH
jgi:glycosyltransferase involved in cell wall biosynthesis